MVNINNCVGSCSEHTLRDCYLHQIAEAGRLRHAASEAHSDDEEDELSSRSLDCEFHADAIAHCIAWFGNLELSASELDVAIVQAKQDTFPFEDIPIRRGLHLIDSLRNATITARENVLPTDF